MNIAPMEAKVLITEVGWFMTKCGKPVAIQYWDHHFQPTKNAHWRGMMILETEDRQIRDWLCVWYTVHGEGHSADWKKLNYGDWDIARKLEPDEIPADKPAAWMPGYDDAIRVQIGRGK